MSTMIGFGMWWNSRNSRKAYESRLTLIRKVLLPDDFATKRWIDIRYANRLKIFMAAQQTGHALAPQFWVSNHFQPVFEIQASAMHISMIPTAIIKVTVHAITPKLTAGNAWLKENGPWQRFHEEILFEEQPKIVMLTTMVGQIQQDRTIEMGQDEEFKLTLQLLQAAYEQYTYKSLPPK